MADVVDLYPEATVVGSKVCLAFLANLMHKPFKQQAVKGGDKVHALLQGAGRGCSMAGHRPLHRVHATPTVTPPLRRPSLPGPALPPAAD